MYFKLITTFLLLGSFSLFAQIVGDASWYGKKFQDKPTASGEPFNMYAYTTAHRTLPFGTRLKVTNLKNNKSVEVRVNDRGPFKKERIVDLSYNAAKKIGLIKAGVVKVSIEEIVLKKEGAKKTSLPENSYLTDEEINARKNTKLSRVIKNDYSSKAKYVSPSKKITNIKPKNIKLQIASFSTKNNAKNFIKKEKKQGFNMQVVNVFSKTADKTFYKVMIKCSSLGMATRIMKSKQYNGSYVVG